jgi:hypothetical protein
VIRLVLDREGRLAAVSLRRFAQAVNEEFPELRVEVHTR